MGGLSELKEIGMRCGKHRKGRVKMTEVSKTRLVYSWNRQWEPL